jgi:hypothetical protein
MVPKVIRPKLRRYFFAFFLLLVHAVLAADVRDLQPTVILISIDGFRND